jgi:small subunit ribosomal protein S16
LGRQKPLTQKHRRCITGLTKTLSIVILSKHKNMLIIRLQRTGTKNKADFRIVLAQSYRSASKKVLEVLGHYNPRSKNFGIKDQERLTYWLNQHVSVSPTVHNLFVEKKLVTAKKVKAWRPKMSSSGAKEGVPASAASGGVEAKA